MDAAVAGGFTSFALPAETAATERGHDLRTMRRMADDRGVPIRHVDTVTAWTPVRVPSTLPKALVPRFDVPMDDLRRLLDAFDIRTLQAVGGYDAGAVPFDVVVAGFAERCDEAAGRGIDVDLEFMPFFGVPDLQSARDVVKTAARPNGGIMIDTWHFAKGRLDLDLLRATPAAWLRNVQISDATVRLAGSDLLDETLDHRRFPGEGEMPLVEILSILRDKGGVRHVGPEVFSLEADALSPLQAGTRSGDTTRTILRAAGFADM